VKEELLKRITPSNLIKSSKRHYNIYSKALYSDKKSATLRMVLFYAVECKLKAMGYAPFKKQFTYSQMKKQHPNLSNLLTKSHDINGLMDELKRKNMYPKWIYKDIENILEAELKSDTDVKFNIEEVHLCWRYGVELDNDSEETIVEWLEDVYKKICKIKVRD